MLFYFVLYFGAESYNSITINQLRVANRAHLIQHFGTTLTRVFGNCALLISSWNIKITPKFQAQLMCDTFLLAGTCWFNQPPTLIFHKTHLVTA